MKSGFTSVPLKTPKAAYPTRRASASGAHPEMGRYSGTLAEPAMKPAS